MIQIAFVMSIFLVGANYPNTISIAGADIINLINGTSVPPTINGDHISLCNNAAFEAGHNCSTGAELAEHFAEIPGPLKPTGDASFDIGTAALRWQEGFIRDVLATEVNGPAINTTLQLQGGASPGSVTIFEDQTSATQRELQIYGPSASVDYLTLSHNGTNATLDVSSGVMHFAITGVGDARFFFNDAAGQNYIQAYAPASAENLAIGSSATEGIIDASVGLITLKDDLKLDVATSGDISSANELTFDDNRVSFGIPLTIEDTAAGGGHDTHDLAWSANLTLDHQAIFNAINYLADNISGAATLQGAYDNGNEIAAPEGRDVHITLDDAAVGTPSRFIVDGTGSQAGDAYMVIGGESYDPLDNSDGALIYYDQEIGEDALNIVSTGLVARVVSFVVENSGKRLIVNTGTDVCESGFEVCAWSSGVADDFILLSGNDLKLDASDDTHIDADDTVNLLGTNVAISPSTSVNIIPGGGIFLETADSQGVNIGDSGTRTKLSAFGLVALDEYAGGPMGTACFDGTPSTTVETVSNVNVGAASRIFITSSGTGQAGFWRTSKSNGVSFSVHSSAAEATTACFDWLMVQ